MRHARSLATSLLGATVPPSLRLIRVSEMNRLGFAGELGRCVAHERKAALDDRE